MSLSGGVSYVPLPEVQSVALADGVQLDAFGRLRVSTATTLFDSQQEYGLDTLRIWDITANGVFSAGSSNGSVASAGNAVGPTSTNTRLTPVTVSPTTGHYAILQSRQYIRYIPGKSHLVLLTGVFSPGPVANTVASSGYFDSANGIFLQVSSGAASIVRRSSTSGAAVNVAIPQASWNLDKFDGTGPSGLVLDLTKTQILFISAQWLGVGRVVIGFDIDGQLIPAHAFLNANALTVPYTQSFNLPVRMELRNSGASTGGSIQFGCCSVQSEGGDEVRGFPLAAALGVTSTAVTTRRPVMSIRPKASYNGRVNRGHIEGIAYLMRTTTNDSFYEVVVGGTLTGAAFASAGVDSISEVDTAATAIAGGVTVLGGFALSGSGVVATSAQGDTDLRTPLTLSQIDALTATQPIITLVCTSFSGTSNVSPTMNWHEQTI